MVRASSSSSSLLKRWEASCSPHPKHHLRRLECTGRDDPATRPRGVWAFTGAGPERREGGS